MDIESAFADGPFGSGEPAPHERGPTGEEPIVQSEPAQRDAAVSAKDDKAASEKQGRDDSEDENDDDLDVAAPNLDGLRKALKSERSLNRKQRREIKATLARLEHLERQNQQIVQHVTAPRQPEAPVKPDAPKPDEDDGFFTKGPDFVRNVVQTQIGQVQSAFEQQRVAFQRTRIADAEESFIDHGPEDGRKFLDSFKALAANDPDLRAKFETVADGRHPHYRSPVKFAYEYAKEYQRLQDMSDPEAYRAKIRAEVEAELRGGGAVGGGSRDAVGRRTPLTLAGRRGGGGVTQAQPERMSVETAFKF